MAWRFYLSYCTNTAELDLSARNRGDPIISALHLPRISEVVKKSTSEQEKCGLMIKVTKRG
jgi:hypothetical protein